MWSIKSCGRLDCNCIARCERNSSEIEVIAYAESKDDNNLLDEYFFEKNFSGQYVILQGIDKREVNSID